MRFVFPQVAGLGHSAMAQRFAISSSEEAAAYLSHPLLGHRLRECTALVNAVEDRSILTSSNSRRPEVPLVDDPVQRGWLRTEFWAALAKFRWAA